MEYIQLGLIEKEASPGSTVMEEIMEEGFTRLKEKFEYYSHRETILMPPVHYFFKEVVTMLGIKVLLTMTGNRLLVMSEESGQVLMNIVPRNGEICAKSLVGKTILNEIMEEYERRTGVPATMTYRS